MDRSSAPFTQPLPQLLQQVGRACRDQGLPASAELAFGRWIRRLLASTQPRHPLELGAADVAGFLAQVVADHPRPGALPQARLALRFLYESVLGTVPPWLASALDAAPAPAAPAGLTPAEVQLLLDAMPGPAGLLCALLHATGISLHQGLRLRVGDVRVARCELVLRDTARKTERALALPARLMPALQAQLSFAEAVHRQDVAAGKCPAGARRQAAGAQAWLFPDTPVSPDSADLAGMARPRSASASVRRHHLDAAAVQTALTLAARRAGVRKPCTSQSLRDSAVTLAGFGLLVPQGTSTVQPVVLRASRSRCACAASSSA